MLIWHIDYNKSVFLSNQVNSTASRNRCHLITADGSANYLLGNTSSTAQMAAWPRDINYITPDTEITLSANYIYSKGPLKDVYITNIAYDPETGKSSFDYNMVTSTPDVTTVLHTPELRGTGTIDHRTVCFKWDPVEGATSYQFTLYRINSQGNIAYENFFNDKDLGNVTEFEYTFASNKLNTEWTAWIRPVIGLPSKQTSNLQVFKPSELAVSGVEEIESAAQPVVKGLKGAIDAPASARVFTLTGAPAGRTDLPAGIYLVQVDGKTFKVLVK